MAEHEGSHEFSSVFQPVIVYRVRLSGRSSAKIAAALGHTIQDGRDANFPTWWHLRIELDRILPNSIRSNPLSLPLSLSLSLYLASLDFLSLIRFYEVEERFNVVRFPDGDGKWLSIYRAKYHCFTG